MSATCMTCLQKAFNRSDHGASRVDGTRMAARVHRQARTNRDCSLALGVGATLASGGRGARPREGRPGRPGERRPAALFQFHRHRTVSCVRDNRHREARDLAPPPPPGLQRPAPLCG
eukprot:2030354-Prymnesium_polylepis.1